jgi:hypothetical protein
MTRRSTSQAVTVTVIASGPQAVDVFTEGSGGAGSYITIVTTNVMITVHDMQPMRTYSDVWTDMRTAAVHLPTHRVIAVENAARRMPGLVIAAHGQDRTFGLHRVARNDIAIRIGYVTWILTDTLAFRSMAGAWEHALTAGEGGFLPRTADQEPVAVSTGRTDRRRVFPAPAGPDESPVPTRMARRRWLAEGRRRDAERLGP